MKLRNKKRKTVRNHLSRKEAAKRRLKNYQFQAILILVGGIVASLLIQYVSYGGEDFGAALSKPVSWLALATASFTVFMSVVIFIKAYAFYLFARILDTLSTVSTRQIPPGEVKIAPMARPQPIQTAQPTVSSEVVSSHVPSQQRELPVKSLTKPGAKLCPYCGKELPLGDIHVFCPFCGKKLK